jgi:hypothetical protein
MNIKDEYDLEDMKEHFMNRTIRHIKKVHTFCDLIVSQFPDLKELSNVKIHHDLSKFEDPEHVPYVYIAWKYKMDKEGKDIVVPYSMKEKMIKATEHHVNNNKHHPEYWSNETDNLINPENRDKPLRLIDATKMPDIYIAEMCADWMAVSKERGSNPIEWADMNIGTRWHFDDDQIELIYDILNTVYFSKI